MPQLTGSILRGHGGFDRRSSFLYNSRVDCPCRRRRATNRKLQRVPPERADWTECGVLNIYYIPSIQF